MAEEKTVALDCDQYEDFKEEFIKASRLRLQSCRAAAIIQP